MDIYMKKSQYKSYSIDIWVDDKDWLHLGSNNDVYNGLTRNGWILSHCSMRMDLIVMEEYSDFHAFKIIGFDIVE